MDVFEAARSWDPACIKATEYKFSKKKKEKELPRRLLLSDFSETYGSRPGGNHIKQLRWFLDYLPNNFSLTTLGSVPCAKDAQGLPFLAPDKKIPDKKIPASRWCVLSALKLLGEDLEVEGRCMTEIREVVRNGVQVHWVEVSSYARFLIHLTAADVKSEVRLRPHLCEDAMHFYSLISETQDTETAKKAYLDSLKGSFGERRYKARELFRASCWHVVVETITCLA